jgi:hypothetical protein
MSIIYFIIRKEDDSIILSVNDLHDKSVERAQLVLVDQNLKHLYTLSYMHLEWSHIVFFYSSQYTCRLHCGLILYLLHEIYLYNSIQFLTLNVKSDNFRALSLYKWLGYALLQQRSNYYSSTIYCFHLVHHRSSAKNCWRRLLILH